MHYCKVRTKSGLLRFPHLSDGDGSRFLGRCIFAFRCAVPVGFTGWYLWLTNCIQLLAQAAAAITNHLAVIGKRRSEARRHRHVPKQVSRYSIPLRVGNRCAVIRFVTPAHNVSCFLASGSLHSSRGALGLATSTADYLGA